LLQDQLEHEIVLMEKKAAKAEEKAAVDAAKAAADAAQVAADKVVVEAETIEDSVVLMCLKRDLAMALQEAADESAADLASAAVRPLFDTVRIIAPTRNYWQFLTGLPVDVTVDLCMPFGLSVDVTAESCMPFVSPSEVSLCLRRPCNRFPMAQGSSSRRTSWQALGSSS
jgi:hypothetical protein